MPRPCRAASAPRLLATFDTGGWVALVFEDVDGWTPAQPWDPAELTRVLDALADLALALTPAPIAAPPVADALGPAFRGWRQFASQAEGGTELAGLDPWAIRNLAGLAGLEASWESAAAGDSLVHADIRADNLLLTPDRVFVVDWPWACLAQPWLDLLGLLPSVRMQGGPPPQAIFDQHPVARDADPAAVTAVLAGLAG